MFFFQSDKSAKCQACPISPTFQDIMALTNILPRHKLPQAEQAEVSKQNITRCVPQNTASATRSSKSPLAALSMSARAAESNDFQTPSSAREQLHSHQGNPIPRTRYGHSKASHGTHGQIEPHRQHAQHPRRQTIPAMSIATSGALTARCCFIASSKRHHPLADCFLRSSYLTTYAFFN